MGFDKQTANQLARFAIAFREARERGANESDTVMYLVKFFEDVLGFDSLKGEISKELAIKDRYCDVALKVDGTVRLLVEAKAAKPCATSSRRKLSPTPESWASRSAARSGDACSGRTRRQGRRSRWMWRKTMTLPHRLRARAPSLRTPR